VPQDAGPSLAPAPSSGLHGLGVSPVPRKPPLMLRDTVDRPYDLLATTKGRLTYLYFGYTHCPDECPTTMADLAAALRMVKPAVRRNVTVVFVTTDPKRDDGHQLRSWLDNFDASFVGLTGSAAQIAQAERLAGVPLAAPESDGHGGYGVSHSTEVFAFSPDGLSHVVYASGFAPSDYAHDMPLLLARR
jgi:protein SCO1/2